VKINTAITVTACAVLCALFGCAPKKDPIPVGERVITEPHQEFGDATLFFYENGVKRWRLDADYMSKPLVDAGDVLVVPVRITVYDSLGRQSARIVSDSGNSNSNMESFDLWGSVYIKNDDGMTVKSERLKWYRDRRKVTSETYVQIQTKKGDVLRGRGLDAKDDFSRFSFMADVRGRFPDFKRRMEQDDEDFFK